MANDTVTFTTSVDGLSDDAFEGFFEGWPNPPSAPQLRAILQRSYAAVIAVDGSSRAVGFVNAISDGELFAFIPLLEVLPEYRHRAIGSELVTRIVALLDGMYAIDLSCDADLVAFYEKLGFGQSGAAMMIRNYTNQSGLSRKQPVKK
ncbi:MAG: hypothetical protein QOG90_491 [Actinomycetota bacterium]|jgi:ribosomal protein S18 acetylase RimI-like enzyme